MWSRDGTSGTRGTGLGCVSRLSVFFFLSFRSSPTAAQFFLQHHSLGYSSYLLFGQLEDNKAASEGDEETRLRLEEV